MLHLFQGQTNEPPPLSPVIDSITASVSGIPGHVSYNFSLAGNDLFTIKVNIQTGVRYGHPVALTNRRLS